MTTHSILVGLAIVGVVALLVGACVLLAFLDD